MGKGPINRKPALIQLPTKSPIQYRGKYPDRLRHISYGSRGDLGIAHFEIFGGTRFIVEKIHMKVWPSIEKNHDIDFLIEQNGLQVIRMKDREYEHYLGFVNALRRIRREAEENPDD